MKASNGYVRQALQELEAAVHQEPPIAAFMLRKAEILALAAVAVELHSIDETLQAIWGHLEERP